MDIIYYQNTMTDKVKLIYHISLLQHHFSREKKFLMESYNLQDKKNKIYLTRNPFFSILCISEKSNIYNKKEVKIDSSNTIEPPSRAHDIISLNPKSQALRVEVTFPKIHARAKY